MFPRFLIRSILGGSVGCILFTFGLIQLIGLLQKYLSPPVAIIPNFGQFGFIVIASGFWGTVLGSTACIRVFGKFRDWSFVYTIGVLAICLFHSNVLWDFGFHSSLTISLAICAGTLALIIAMTFTIPQQNPPKVNDKADR